MEFNMAINGTKCMLFTNVPDGYYHLIEEKGVYITGEE